MQAHKSELNRLHKQLRTLEAPHAFANPRRAVRWGERLRRTREMIRAIERVNGRGKAAAASASIPKTYTERKPAFAPVTETRQSTLSRVGASVSRWIGRLRGR